MFPQLQLLCSCLLGTAASLHPVRNSPYWPLGNRIAASYALSCWLFSELRISLLASLLHLPSCGSLCPATRCFPECVIPCCLPTTRCACSLPAAPTWIPNCLPHAAFSLRHLAWTFSCLAIHTHHTVSSSAATCDLLTPQRFPSRFLTSFQLILP